MREIAQMTQIIVKRAKEYDNDTIPGDYATLVTPCPNCGGVVKENYRRFACTKCEFSMSKTPGSRQFEIRRSRRTAEEPHHRPAAGFPLEDGAAVRGDPEASRATKRSRTSSSNSISARTTTRMREAVDFTGQTALGPCPKCGSGVYEMGLAYVCEKTVAKPKTCDFRSGRIILQQEILPEQMAKLLNDGKTDLLPGFVSQRTRRPFKAFLVKGKDGKISFEFEERKPKAPAKGKAARRRSRGDGSGHGNQTGQSGQESGGTAKKAAAKKPARAKAAAKKVAA